MYALSVKQLVSKRLKIVWRAIFLARLRLAQLYPACSFLLSPVQLSSTQLNSAQLSSTQLDSAWLSSAQLDSAWLSSTQLDSAELSSTQLNSTQLNSARLSLAWLDLTQHSSASSLKFKTSPFCLNTFELSPLIKANSTYFILVLPWTTILLVCLGSPICQLAYCLIY